MKKGYLLALLICSALFVGAQEKISLEQCIRQALEANWSIKMVRAEHQIAENNAGLTPFLPTLGIDAQQSQRINSVKTETHDVTSEENDVKTNTLSAGVALKWRLFDGLSMFVTYDKSRELAGIGELNLQMAIEELIASVSAAYYDVIVQHSKLDASQHSLDLSRERFAEAQDKYNLGVLSGLDLQQAKIDLNTDISKYMKQKELLKSAYITLNTIMNTDLQQAMYVQDSIVLRAPLLFETLKSDTREYNTLLEIARKDQRISVLDVKQARSALFPTLDFSGGYNLSRTEIPSAATRYNRTHGPYWGFSLSMNLFDRLENRRKIRNAKIGREKADWSYMEIELQTMADLAQLFNTYENNLQIVDFENESAGVAYENLGAALEKYKLGTLSGIEFREFQRSYIDANDRKLAAIYDAKVSELKLLLISGKIIGER